VAAPLADPPGLRPETTDSYLICATPRTGSYLLCDALTATGVAGKPTEYLLPGYRSHWSDQWGVSTYRDYHDRVLADGTTPNGVFGAKVHAAQLLDFLQRATGQARVGNEDRPAVVEAWFPRPRYIWLRRRDAVAQGVSWSKACQTRLWWDTDAPPAPPLGVPAPDMLRFDYGFIERSMYSLSEWDGVWRTYFDATDVQPLTVWYEDLVLDYRRSVDRVLDHLGVQPPAGGEVGPPGFRRQADGTSAVWASRFERLESAKRESTLAALAGLHAGETVYICAGPVAVDRVPRDAVTIALDGAWSPAPASYALLTRTPAKPPSANVVVTTGPTAVDHPFVVRCLLDRGSGGTGRRNRLPVGCDESPRGIALALAEHLGAARIEMAGA
jgi:trehalose 2-sulfotransferase